MADVYLCGHCGSTNLMHRMTDVQCLACGNKTGFDGNALAPEPDFPGGPTAFDRRPT